MKHITLLTLLVAAMGMPLQAQSINGQGEVVKQEIQLATLTGVKLGFQGNIVLTQGSTQKIVMEGQQNVLDNIKREVKNGTWGVYNKKNVRNAKPVTIYITLANLQEVAVSGSGNITGTNRFRGLGDLGIAVSGSGNIDLEIEAADVSASVSGSGEVRLAGSAANLALRISGSGDVEAEDLQVTDCTAHISGSGNARVHASGSLEATISGSGDLRYRGAANVRSRVSGSGDIKKM
ncbi:MAG: head GIN domain-containing protein [Saprospiraceae bacterium]|nr:head GIN domain-containing protein [Saprospiraceae bacterium]